MGDCISTHARQVLFHTFRLYQPRTHVELRFIKGKERHVFAAAKYPTGGLKLVSYSGNLHNVAAQGKEKVPSGAHIQFNIRMKECTGNVFTATFSAASVSPKG